MGIHPVFRQFLHADSGAFAYLLADTVTGAAVLVDPVLGDVPQLDIVDTVCGPERCPLKDDGNWVSAGFNHLTDDFTISQVPEVEAVLRQVLEEG